MKDIEISMNFVFHGNVINEIRGDHGTDGEADAYSDGMSCVFLKLVESLKNAGVHPEILEIAVKRFRVDLDQVKDLIYSPRPQERP